MLFSERQGYKIPKQSLQLESIDVELKNSLWNLVLDLFKEIQENSHYPLYDPRFQKNIWRNFLKKPIDEFIDRYSNLIVVREYFFSKFEWYEIYDFLEFLSESSGALSENFQFACNLVLERENSAYRFIDSKIIPLTNQSEIREIEKLIDSSKGKLSIIQTHISKALELMSDRRNPDYRNSIKESISAIESLCKLITGEENATLGQALNKLEKKVKISPALKQGFEKIYGYTNSPKEGIRHSLLESSKSDLEDARFMLVSCSAFGNYLIEKANKAEIKLG